MNKFKGFTEDTGSLRGGEMKRKGMFFILAGWILLCVFPVRAQFKPEEVKEWARWEEFLKSADIVQEEQMGGSQAVTNPWKLTLEKDGITNFALWKNPEGMKKGFMEGWKWEIAAYLLDRHLDLNMIPPTVERRFKGSRGSVQLWVDVKLSLKEKNKNKIKTPSHKVFYWNRALYLQRAFDNLIANEDRHAGNIQITEDWRIILIDHSRSFRTSKKFTKKLIYDAKFKEGPREMKELPRAFMDKIKELTADSVREIVGEYLTDAEIGAVLIRRDLIVKEINRRIQEFGEEKVLY